MKTTDKILRLIIRIIATPLVFSLLLLTILNVIKNTIMFTIYGGEWVRFEAEDKITIKQLYNELKKKSE